ncbi:RHS repeat protein [Reyranella sp. CPCC 100927]|uniref:RHS repeat protein n=1 Tax=Reyranella sp. CPCC 100927 TaxID=2599616 RepID=UPI0011B688B3|nr:RHS repeat protein [Reyranella sp. CPCC 100927]TWT13031.1 RHS repeat protein [Reyranella sp. CPCC 100927]
MAGEIPLTPAQYSRLMSETGNGTKDYYKGYRLIYEFIKDDPSIDINIKFFFKEAAEINSNDPLSASNAFIRQVTRLGFVWDGLFSGDATGREAQVQANSDAIGFNIFREIIRNGTVPSVAQIIPQDALTAVSVGHQSIGGWAGAFYFWNVVLSDGVTVGSKIAANPQELEKFIAINARALFDTMAKFGNTGENILNQIWAGFDAQVPLAIKAEIAERALQYFTTGDTKSFAGNPNSIDGYRPIYGSNGQVVGWAMDLPGFPPQEVVDPILLDTLNQRREIRLQRRDDLPWQESSYRGSLQDNPDGTKLILYADADGVESWSTTQVAVTADGTVSSREVTYDTGVVEDTTFDTQNNQLWTSRTQIFDPTGRETERDMRYDNGTARNQFFDVQGNQEWVWRDEVFDATGVKVGSTWQFDTGVNTQYIEDPHGAQSWRLQSISHGANGGLANHDWYYDDGRIDRIAYDANGTEAWQQYTDRFNAAGAWTERDMRYDNGTARNQFFDVQGNQDWVWRDEVFDATGVKVGSTWQFDTGVNTQYIEDPHNAQSWRLQSISHDANGGLTNHDWYYDDGRRYQQWFDPHNTTSQGLSGGSNSYDATGTWTGYEHFYDNGWRTRHSFDPYDSQDWQSLTDTYDPNGNLVTREGVNDDGFTYRTVWDADGTRPWSSYTDFNSLDGQRWYRQGINDNGTTFRTTWQGEISDTYTYNADGSFLYRDVYNGPAGALTHQSHATGTTVYYNVGQSLGTVGSFPSFASIPIPNGLPEGSIPTLSASPPVFTFEGIMLPAIIIVGTRGG